MSVLDGFRQKVYEASHIMSTKAELVEYYQATYPARGKGSWKQRIVNDLATLTGKKAKSLEKRFDSGVKGGKSRLSNPEPRNAAEYKALGEQIGPIPPQHGYLVTYHGEIRISNACFPRDFTVLIAGDEARHLAATGDIFIVYRTYFQGQDTAEGWCGEPFITVEPASAGSTQMAFQHGPQGESKFAGIMRRRR